MTAAKPPKKPVSDSLEQAIELVKGTGQKAVHEVVDTFNPLSILFENPTQEERKKGKNDFTDVDFDKLNKTYQEQDSPELAKVREQLNGQQPDHLSDKQRAMDYHQRVQREEEEYNLKKEQEEEEEKREEAIEKQQKKQMAEEEEAKKQQGGIPKGRERKNIFGTKQHRKATSELPPELRPGAGKQ